MANSSSKGGGALFGLAGPHVWPLYKSVTFRSSKGKEISRLFLDTFALADGQLDTISSTGLKTFSKSSTF